MKLSTVRGVSYWLEGNWGYVAIVVVAIVVVSIVAMVAISECGPPSGEVTAKDFSPAHYLTQMSYAGNTPIITQVYIPPAWRLRLDDGTDEGWREVDRSTYENVHIGDYYQGE